MKRLILIFATLFLFQCEKDTIGLTESVKNLTQDTDKNLRVNVSRDSDGFLELGEKIVNPYSIPNMEKALKSLKEKKMDTKDFKIKENYLYVRVLPSNESEFNKVNSDTEIDLFEYPLDYTIKKRGNKYHDPSLKDSNYTWLYCAVPTTKAFDKNLKVEVLEKLFLPFGNGKDDEYSQKNKAEQEANETLFTALEEESLRLTGNAVAEKKAKVAWWNPSGRIRVWDERLQFNDFNNSHVPGSGFIPVPQCLVRARRIFTTKTQLTNEQGFYTFSHTFSNGNLEFSIKWDRADFDIRSGSYGQAYFNGPSQSTNWNLNITEFNTPDNYIYAHVHRAAWYYYYKNTFGVNGPPTKTFFDFYGVANLVGQKMHLGAKQGGLRSHYFQFNGNWLASQIKLIFDLSKTDPNGDDNIDDGRGIFATTIHELAHAAHWAIGMNYAAYVSNAGQAGRLAESWAQAVGWHITRQIYSPNPSLLGANIVMEDKDDKQLMSLTDMNSPATALTNGPWYTPIFIDLIDNFNQDINLANRPTDVVSGFQINYLQNVLIQRPTNWYMYRDYIQANPPANGVINLAAGIQLFSDYD